MVKTCYGWVTDRQMEWAIVSAASSVRYWLKWCGRIEGTVSWNGDRIQGVRYLS